MNQTLARISIPDDFPPVISGTPALQTMQAHGDVTVYTSRPETPDELVTRIREAHTVVNIRAYCKFTAAVLQACPHLQHLAIWGTGTDNVDLAAAQAAGIVVTGLDHGVGHFRPLSIARQRHLLVYHGIAMRSEDLCQVF